jgi:hypothetical protein
MADEDDELEAEEEFEAGADEEVGDDFDDGDTAIADEEDEDEADAEIEPIAKPVTRSGTRKKRVEADSLHTVAARKDLRQKLADDVEAFLKRGGAIQDVPQDQRADPPKKPESNYGRGSI